MPKFKPMKAKSAEFNRLRFPLFASPKFDGIRAVNQEGELTSNSLLPIPNKHIQALFANCEHLDGELISGSPTSATVYKASYKEVMSHDRTNGCTFYVFDHVEFPDAPYKERLARLQAINYANVIVVEQVLIYNLEDLLAFEDKCLNLGYEGIMTRDPEGTYKFGRSTAISQELNKIKRFEDAECTIVGFEELMHNDNEKVINELGRSKRSTHAAGLVPMDTLGALICLTDKNIQFKLGSGFDDEERDHIWANKEAYLNTLYKYKFFPIGTDVKPRHPIALGPRSPIDI